MNWPPGLAPTTDRCPRASSGGRETLPRKIRDEIAHRFMAEFPGMSGAMAVRFAKAMLADVKDERDAERIAHMDRDQLARLMAELPLGMTRARKVAPRAWAVRS